MNGVPECDVHDLSTALLQIYKLTITGDTIHKYIQLARSKSILLWLQELVNQVEYGRWRAFESCRAKSLEGVRVYLGRLNSRACKLPGRRLSDDTSPVWNGTQALYITDLPSQTHQNFHVLCLQPRFVSKYVGSGSQSIDINSKYLTSWRGC